MHDITRELLSSARSIESWLARAWSDTELLATTAAQHTTSAALQLITLTVVCTAGVLILIVFTKRRVCVARAVRRSSIRYAAALSGLQAFQQAKQSFGVTKIEGSATAMASTARTRPRVETKVMDVAPYREQQIIDLFAHFKWVLKSSTPVYSQDTHLETRGDSTYSVTETTNYVHLVFERDLDDPNIQRVKELEWEYFSIVIPTMPSYAGPIIICILGAMTGFGLIIAVPLCVIWSMNIKKRREIAAIEIPRLRARQMDILEEVDRL